jgi:putative Holliday junction resolvase
LGRILAIDYGRARAGCALSDPSGTLATPLLAVEEPDSEQGLERIARIVSERDVEAVVVGLPIGLTGKEGPQAAETRKFAEKLAAKLGIPIHTYDERFTTRLAQRSGGRSAEDSRAAAHLLTDYLRARAATRETE